MQLNQGEMYVEEDDIGPETSVDEIVVTGTRPRPSAQTGLQRFISTMNRLEGPARPSLFAVDMIVPGGDRSTSEHLAFLCEATALPGLSVATQDEYAPQGFGVIQKMPWNVLFNGVTLSFIGDNQGRVHKSFVDWIGRIVNYNVENVNTQSATTYPFLVNYRANYATNVRITLFDPKGKETIEYTLWDAYPTGVQDIPVSWGDSNYMRINVPFSFTRWTVKHTKWNSVPTDTADDLTISASNFVDRIGRTIQNSRYTAMERVTDLFSTRINSRVTDFMSGIVGQVPPAVQDVYQRALPLLGGISDFKF